VIAAAAPRPSRAERAACYTKGMKPVIALSALLVVALIGLVLWLGRSSEPSSPPAQAAAPPKSSPPPPLANRNDPGAPIVRDVPAGAEPPPEAPPVNTYTVGNVIVREHRPGAEPLTKPPDFTPPEGIHLTAEFAQHVTNVMADPAKQCIPTLPAPMRSDTTRLNLTMTVAVKNGSLTVTGVEGGVTGLDDPAFAPTLGCLRGKMIGRSVDAAGQPDVPSYSISTYYTAK
jgi:hypothetical protein